MGCDKHKRFNKNCKQCLINRDRRRILNKIAEDMPKFKTRYAQVFIDKRITKFEDLRFSPADYVYYFFELMEKQGYEFFTQLADNTYLFTLIFKKKEE